MSALDIRYFPKSQINTLTQEFVLASGDVLSSAELFRHTVLFDTTLSGLSVQLIRQREFGYIDFELQINGVPLPDWNLHINGSSTSVTQILTLTQSLVVGDLVSVVATSNSFSPMPNRGLIFLVLR